MKKISLVAPVYGVEKYIDQFLDSIRHQTFADFEAILVDDGSKDRCPEILDRFAQEDPRYRVIHQKNGGVSAARNTGIEHASGEYIYIVDSDDWLEPTALEALWKEAERTGADIIYGDYISEKSTGKTIRQCFPRPFVTDDPDTISSLQFAINSNGYKIRMKRPEFSEITAFGGAPWRSMLKMSILKENNLRFDPYVRGLGDDILFSLHVYEYVKKVAYIQSVIYHYRTVDLSYSHGYKSNYPETVARILEKHEAFLKAYHKNEFAWGSYYLRVLIYLQQGMERYFRNPDNPRPEAERYQEFRQLIRTEPYKTAKQKAPIHYFGTKRLRITACLLRVGLDKWYWKLIMKNPSRPANP